MKKVLVSVPSARGEMLLNTRLSIGANVTYANQNGYEVHLIDEYDAPVHMLRNLSCYRAVDYGYDFLVMIDSDMYLHSVNILKRMLDRFQEREDDMVLAALAVQRKPPYKVVAFTKESDHIYKRITNLGEGILEVDAFGTGMVVIPVRVLKKLPEPYFMPEKHPTAPREPIGEDVGFCRQCQAHGVRCFVDMDVDVGHFEYVPFTVRQCEEIPIEQRRVWEQRMEGINVRGFKNES